MLRTSLAALVLLAVAAGARADRMAPIASPVERALRAPVVVVGKVTAIEKGAVDAPVYPGSPNKVAHTIAVVKVESGLVGADGLTHIKVGFVSPAAEKAGGIRPGRGLDNPELKVDQEWLFFLHKNEAGFYAMAYLTPPVLSSAMDYKASVESAKKILAAVADPAKALKAEKAEDRFSAAVATITRFRVPREGEGAREFENVPLSADESKLILKALAEGAWKAEPASRSFNGYGAFAMLGLSEADGWKPTQPPAGADFFEHTRAEFAKWLDGPGKAYRVKKLVPKKTEKK